MADECGVAETIAIHYSSVANQASFVVARDKLAIEKDKGKAMALIAAIEGMLREEISLAKRMAQLQGGDSRLGFEASNHYFYVCNDLAEKVVNCRDPAGSLAPELRSMW